VTHAFDLDPCTGIMFGYEESASFTLGQKIVSGEKIAGNGLGVASPQASAWNECAIGGEHQGIGYRGQRRGNSYLEPALCPIRFSL